MAYELIHDTIAKQIFSKASTEAQTRRKIEKYIRERFQSNQERGAKLSQDDLDYVTPYLGQVNISGEEVLFINNSRKELMQARQRRQLITAIAIIVLLAFYIFARRNFN